MSGIARIPEADSRQLLCEFCGLEIESADQDCEWCDDGPLDNPEVHHITPRNEGGPNARDNLIVLCPTCHRKADNGGISRTKLRGKLKHILSQEA